MTTAGETVSLRIPVWAREAIIHLAWSLTASDSTELLESVNAALHLDLTRHGSTHAAVSADHLMALQVIADHVLTVCPQSERQGWAQFRAAVQDGQATLSNEIAWRMETIYQHVVAVRSTWVVQPSGSKCRVRGVRVSMASRTSSFVCWVEAGNGRKLGVMPDTNQRYGRESLNLRFEQIEGIGNPVLRSLREGTAVRYPWLLGLPYVDYPKPEPLSVAPFAYGEPARWFQQTN